MIDNRIIDAFQAFPLHPGLLCLATVGSQAHGTWLPKDDPGSVDDVDLMGIVLPPPHRVIGLHEWEHWTLQQDELDVTLYSLRKFVGLLVKSNPNVIGTLWLREEDYLHVHPAFQILLDQRDLFSTRQAYQAFAGYARGQIHRMEHFDDKARSNLRLIEEELLYRKVDVSRFSHWQPNAMDVGDVMTVRLSRIDVHAQSTDNLKTLYHEYRIKYTSGYMGEKRRKLVERYGFDTKNAAHAIRLLRMSIEFLRTGRMQVYRVKDAETLKGIKQGEWSLRQVKAEADRLFLEAESAYRSSPLPEKPDEGIIDWVLEVVSLEGWKGRWRYIA